jgi:hypothetical protein
MDYKEIISRSLQNHAPTAINMHKIENHFIMEIDYDVIVNAIVDNLNVEGYNIINKQQ